MFANRRRYLHEINSFLGFAGKIVGGGGGGGGGGGVGGGGGGGGGGGTNIFLIFLALARRGGSCRLKDELLKFGMRQPSFTVSIPYRDGRARKEVVCRRQKNAYMS
ncbi:hypothetical protein QE152_g13405 [Popillia japonica]|uniref:Uncharacterized protein n=1 Tax=Popillia japonica TaxID=7064 RepID=A0AAW1LD80_POPJA